jgi:peptide methionine sulfoxide reductase MsrB
MKIILAISSIGCVLAHSATPGLGKGRLCPAIPTQASECKIKVLDPEFEPVCVTREENAEIQQRRCIPGEKAPYYKDSDGIFRCACCGAPLWKPDLQFDQLPAANWPWPSFHSYPENGTDGLPNVCHRGPGYGIYQRNATMDLGLGALGEVGCARCGIHLGDYFDDDDDGHDHYCIDGVCMISPGGEDGSVCAPTTTKESINV